jgi:hypothetical protein
LKDVDVFKLAGINIIDEERNKKRKSEAPIDEKELEE